MIGTEITIIKGKLNLIQVRILSGFHLPKKGKGKHDGAGPGFVRSSLLFIIGLLRR